ncbi:MAG: histone deacetylase [Candidatus Kryptonium sp.]
MKNIGLIYHEDYLKHDTGAWHPERKERLTAIVEHLRKSELNQKINWIAPARRNDVEKWILKVHTPRHVEFVKSSILSGVRLLDFGDTYVSKDSYSVAMLAVSGVLEGVDKIFSGEMDKIFCAVRPPGHHAESERVMGFCLFNNVAIAARYAQEMYGVGKVVIIDWDVHHGNGTQEIFYEDPTVLYISLHQYPFYPGTGSRDEKGSGRGYGFTLNFPMPAGSNDEDYLKIFGNEVVPALEKFQPEFIIISAGFDAHRDDPLAGMNLTEESFEMMTKLTCEVAKKFSNNRILSVLEGGYNLNALASSVETHLKAFIEM